MFLNQGHDLKKNLKMNSNVIYFRISNPLFKWLILPNLDLIQ